MPILICILRHTEILTLCYYHSQYNIECNKLKFIEYIYTNIS